MDESLLHAKRSSSGARWQEAEKKRRRRCADDDDHERDARNCTRPGGESPPNNLLQFQQTEGDKESGLASQIKWPSVIQEGNEAVDIPESAGFGSWPHQSHQAQAQRAGLLEWLAQ